MNILEVKNLTKTYSNFKLDDISFSIEKGKITGFIGRNGAGKSTTLKSILDFVHPDCGSVKFFGKEFISAQNEIKQKIGYVSGGINYYSKKKLSTISSVTKSFYDDWNDDTYKKYIQLFKLDESKNPSQLSEGMKVKYALTLALSHNAEFLILDEPTSGLDPVSRDELLNIFMSLCANGTTILFSTHITSDLEKCADSIVYIKDGKLIEEGNLKDFCNNYKLFRISKDELTDEIIRNAVRVCRLKHEYSVLIKSDLESPATYTPLKTSLEEIMIHLEKEAFENEKTVFKRA